MALWGLPPTVTEAVAGHHDERWLRLPVDGIAVLHVANVLVEELEAEHLPAGLPASELHLAFLQRAGLEGKLEHWRALARRQFFEAAPRP